MLPESAKPGPGLHERVLRQVFSSVPVLNHTLQQRVHQPAVVIDQPAEGLPVALTGKPDITQSLRVFNQIFMPSSNFYPS